MEEEKFPKHIAIIMDGNRRWAKQRKMPAEYGHQKGADTLEKIAKYANKIGIKYLTVYAFSTENFKRSKEEVSALMRILKQSIINFSKRAEKENIRINVFGDISVLSKDLQEAIKDVEERTSIKDGLNLNILFNYGGRAEIIKATKEISNVVLNGKLKIEDITEEEFAKHLYTKLMDDPDLVIRTSKEYRTSNFLPWQITYSEFLFLEKNWPDFNEQDLDEAIEEYKKRNRKFGGK